MMNQAANSSSGAFANHVPLFASSWVALFLVIRHNLSGRQLDEGLSTHTPKSECMRARP